MITFTQVGDTLEGPRYITQFTRGAPVSVTLSDTTFKSNEDIVNPNYTYSLVWQNSPGENIAISALSYDASTNMCTGTVGRAATMCSGLTYVAFAAIDVDANITLTTVAATVDIKRSVDAELGSTEDAQSLSDAITNIVSGKAVSSAGYGASGLGKIPVVDKDGNLAVRTVHLLIDDDTDNGSLVLRGAVGQIIADIALSELKEAIGSDEPEKISNSYWSGYKYPDGRAVLKWRLDVTNKSLSSNNGVYVTDKLFVSANRKYPDIFIEKPDFRATYIPNPNRLHIGAYATFQRGNSETASGSSGNSFYQNPPDVYIVCQNNTNTTLLGDLYMVAEGRWK
jgi:hypothetical protein